MRVGGVRNADARCRTAKVEGHVVLSLSRSGQEPRVGLTVGTRRSQGLRKLEPVSGQIDRADLLPEILEIQAPTSPERER